MSYAIEVHSLTKQFPKPKSFKNIILHPFTSEYTTALQDVSFEANRGEIFGLLGPNGAGKTTLIRILCTTVLQTSGTALMEGYDISKEENKVKSIISLTTSDERSFFWRLTGKQNLEFFASLYNLSPAQSKKRINELLDILELGKIADNLFKNYSTGNKQRMSIARGLLNDAKIILMDEPTKGLDVDVAENLRNFIKEKLIDEDKRTILLTTHYLHEAERLCNKIAIIDQGKIKAVGTLAELRKKLIKRKKIYIKLKNCKEEIFKLIEKIDGITDIKKEIKENELCILTIETIAEKMVLNKILNLLINNAIEIIDCNSEEASLEEIFMAITKDKQ